MDVTFLGEHVEEIWQSFCKIKKITQEGKTGGASLKKRHEMLQDFNLGVRRQWNTSNSHFRLAAWTTIQFPPV